MNILIGLTGTVASILAPKIADKFSENGHKVKFVHTDKVPQFGLIDRYGCIDQKYTTYDDSDEYSPSGCPWRKGEEITHIALRDWADTYLIISSVNTMAKIANGICDNLVTSIARAWDFKKKLYIASAANTLMWTHPITKTHLQVLKSFGIDVIYPTVKKLACGDTGIGALADIDTIVNIVEGHRWELYFIGCPFPYLPLYPHPGSFGVHRKVHCHSGIDGYCDLYENVHAVEDGEVVSFGQFTGEAVGCGYWNDTWYVSVKGKSGTIVYGEIQVLDGEHEFKIGDKIKCRQFLGRVLRVIKNLPKNPPERHSPNMLHLELLRGVDQCPDWKIGDDRPKEILDPTPYLYLLQ